MLVSADNGIYILRTKDQYRVAHLQAIDNVSWSIIDGDWQNNDHTRGKCVPTRVVEMWGDCKFTRNEGKALKLAHSWASCLPICEYGVSIITYNKTWKHILEDARDYAKKEIEFINKSGQENMWSYKLQQLQKIADSDYLSEWLHREQYNKDLRKHDCGYWSVCYDHGCKCTIEKNVDGFDNKVYTEMDRERVKQDLDEYPAKYLGYEV